MSPPARPRMSARPGGEAPAGDDDEVQITAHQGALSDFPHSRENCVTFPLARDPKAFCAQCYCVVCDVPAAKCPC